LPLRNHDEESHLSRRNPAGQDKVGFLGAIATEERAMSSKKLSFALIAGLAVASIMLAAETNLAFAQDRAYGPGPAGPRYGFGGVYDAVGDYPYGPGAIYAPGYIYVPGHGILDAPCGLPTSACPNSQRSAD